MTPTFNSGKRMALGTNHVCVRGKVWRRALNVLALGRALSAVRWAHSAKIVSVPPCFFANTLELFFKTSDFFVGKFFKMDEFIPERLSALELLRRVSNEPLSHRRFCVF